VAFKVIRPPTIDLTRYPSSNTSYNRASSEISKFEICILGEGATADEMSSFTWLRPEIEAEIKLA
jgi:hypothetical protein